MNRTTLPFVFIDMNPDPILTRRTVLVLGAAGAGTVALAACGSSTSSNTPAGSSPAADPTSSAAGAASGAGSAAPPGDVLVKVADIKVGEAVRAKLSSGTDVIVARPTDSTVAAFSATCTHQGCKVNPSGDKLRCPCHGSVYNATTGEVISGPAPRALPKVSVHVVDGSVVADA